MSFINNNDLIVPLDIITLEKYCLWIIFKFRCDPFRQQQNSSRGDLIGGFLDRWINKIPENLIFKVLLEKYDKDKNDGYDVINDLFFYNSETAKNAPDILGLKDKDNKIYKFAVFKENKWHIIEEAPFIEMKTFRETQRLITIPKTQFLDNHYFVFVESHIDELYLLYLFDNLLEKYQNTKIFNDYLEFISDYPNDFIKTTTDVIDINKLKNEIKKKKIKDQLGFYKLLGIYTKKSLDGYYTTVSKILNNNGNDDDSDDQRYRAEKPRYLDSVVKYNYENIPNENSGECKYFKEINAIPIIFNIQSDSKLFMISKNEEEVIFRVDGEVVVQSKFNFGEKPINFNESFKNSFFALKFKPRIRDLIKYYHLVEIVDDVKITVNEEIELESGIFMYYGSDYKINKFMLINNNSDFFICDAKKTVLRFYIGEKSEIHYMRNKKIESDIFEKGYHEIQFNPSGNFKSSKKNIDELNEISIPNIDENSLKLNIELMTKNSALKFIEKRKNDFIVKVDDEAKINDFPVKNNFYKIKIVKNEGLIKKPKIVANPIIKEEKPLHDAFYYHLSDNDENNVPVKITKFKDSELSIIKVNKGSVFVKTKGNGIYIDEFDVSSNEECVWKLTFKSFERSSKKEEIVLSKGAINFLGSDEKKLINHFDTFIQYH